MSPFAASRCLLATNCIRHSKGGSTAASTATLSPVERQRGFTYLSTIDESGPRAGRALSASTASMEEKESPTKAPHSWLTRFLVDAHLSAPSRRWEANTNEAPISHVASNSSQRTNSINQAQSAFHVVNA